jgi:hypothetical protein
MQADERARLYKEAFAKMSAEELRGYHEGWHQARKGCLHASGYHRRMGDEACPVCGTKLTRIGKG